MNILTHSQTFLGISLVILSLSGCESGSKNNDTDTTRLPLNDTGATNFTTSFSPDTVDPLVENLLSSVPDSTAPGQDADLGNDVTNSNDLDGKAGFKFSKLDENGSPLNNQLATYTETPWSCVKDETTGLIWEVKTRSGLRSLQHTYTWYEPDNTLNGGFAGAQGVTDTCDTSVLLSCDSKSYIDAVNSLNNGSGLCGLKSWRLPTREELRSILDYGSYSGFAIDTNFFPNTFNSDTWTSQTAYYNIADGTDAWEFHFDTGISEAHAKSSNRVAVRLVHTP